jgi:ribonuclease-3
MVVAEMLLENFPDEPEGDIAKRHTALVCRDALADIARGMRLQDFIFMSDGEIQAGTHENASVLSDICEATIGAVFLDGGLEPVKAFISSRWQDKMQIPADPPRDPKSSLQDWAQRCGKPLPVYRVTDSVGSSHAPVFTVEVLVEGLPPVTARGSSKKIAEKSAAEQLLQYIKDNMDV